MIRPHGRAEVLAVADFDPARIERAIERLANSTSVALSEFGAQLSDVRERVVAIDTRAEERLRRCDSHGRRLGALEDRRDVTGVGPAPRGAITLDQQSVRVLIYVIAALVLGGSAGASGWAALFGGPP